MQKLLHLVEDQPLALQAVSPEELLQEGVGQPSTDCRDGPDIAGDNVKGLIQGVVS
jgi:hypothetical protein